MQPGLARGKLRLHLLYQLNDMRYAFLSMPRSQLRDELAADYVNELARGLEAYIMSPRSYLSYCRPRSVLT